MLLSRLRLSAVSRMARPLMVSALQCARPVGTLPTLSSGAAPPPRRLAPVACLPMLLGLTLRRPAAASRSEWRLYAAFQPKQLPQAAALGAATTVEVPSKVPAVATEVVVLDVCGMKCGGCSAAVKRILLQQPHMQAAAVNLLTETAVVTVAVPRQGGHAGGAAGQAEELAAAAAQALTAKGFPSVLRSMDDTGVAGDAAALNARREQELKRSSRNLAFAWGLALVCCTHHVVHFLHALGLHQFAHTEFTMALGNPWVSGVLGAAALLGPGRPLLVDGTLSLIRGAPNMNSLIALGASTSFGMGAASALIPSFALDPSFLEEPVMLLAFLLLGRGLEAHARAAASADLSALARLIPGRTRLVLDPGLPPKAAAAVCSSSSAEEVMVATSTVRTGDMVRVLPGERVPMDGLVLSGKASLDESMLTGEARLVAVGEGSSVTGGTLAYEAPLTLRATSTGSASTLAGIGRLVADAQLREAPVQRLADEVAGRFCYGVMATSAATFAFWSLAGVDCFPQALDAMEVAGAQAPLLLSLKLAIDVLVVACPCALGLATPTAVLVASAAGARRGLLLRGGDVVEGLAHVDTVVLDKTGTLTEGRVQLVAVEAQPGCSGDELLQLAVAAERNTRHPLADALLAAAESRGLEVPLASSSHTEPGEGVWAQVGDRLVAVGRCEWVQQRCTASPAGAAAPAASSSQQSTSGHSSSDTEAWVGWSGQGLAGRLLLSDTLRPDAAEVVASLQRRGLRVLLLSGDRQEAVQTMAAAAGIDPTDAYHGMRPKAKAAVVQRLRAEGRHVAMVGDGVNDAPALASADVGIAMGGGTAVASDVAGVVLLGDRLGQVDEALALGRATLAKIRQNLSWAVAYNIVGVPVAAGVLLPAYGVALSPSLAAGAMALSSIAVVSNSVSLRWTLNADAPSSSDAAGSSSSSSSSKGPQLGSAPTGTAS